MEQNKYFPQGASTSFPGELEEVVVDIHEEVKLSKDTVVHTTEYKDDSTGYPVLNDPKTALLEKEFPISQLLEDTARMAYFLKETHNYGIFSARTLDKIIDSCRGWTEESFTVRQE